MFRPEINAAPKEVICRWSKKEYSLRFSGQQVSSMKYSDHST